MNLKEYEDEARKAEESLRQSDRARGAMDAILTSLKEDFGCDSVESARVLLGEARKEKSESADELESAATEFRKKHGERLG